MSVGVDFDFARWLAARRGAMEQQAREGAAYAYSGERAFRRTLQMARPVTIALEATTRLWRDSARAEILAQSAKPTDERYTKLLGRVHEAAKIASSNLRVRLPVIFGVPETKLGIRVLGTDDSPHLVVNLALAAQLDDKELVAAIGHELGHIQNFHIFYATALYFLSHSAAFFVRWIVQPAIMTLQAWSRRAEITCDRAALLASRDLDHTLTQIVRMSIGIGKGDAFDAAAYLKAPPDAKKGVGRYGELFRSHPHIGKRIAALRLFADSALYASLTGADPTGKHSMPDVDKQVGEMISVF